jgi:hypothetical protein
MIAILIQIIENSLSLRVVACLAFLMPTALFYITVTVAAKDPLSFKSMEEKETVRLKNLYDNRTVRQKNWRIVAEFPNFPSKYKKLEVNEYVKVRDRSLENIKRKVIDNKSNTLTHSLNKFYGVEGQAMELKKQALIEIKRLHPFLRRTVPETSKEKILNVIIMIVILILLLLSALI